MREKVKIFPKQKMSFRKKDKKWRKKHLDWADDNSRIFSETIRKRQRDKKINIDFYNGIVHKEDMKLTINPNDMENFYIPDAIQHYPIIAPRIDVLVGEEASRRFDWTVKIINPTSITKMENNKKKEITAKIQEMVSNDVPEEEIEGEMQRFSDFMMFEWQDHREKRANELLKHFVKELNVKNKMSLALKDALIHGEAGFYCDIVHNNPIFEKLNPLKTYVIQHGHSNRYEDASVIVIDDYWSPGKVVDTFNEFLQDKDIDYLMNGSKSHKGGRRMDGDRFAEDLDDREGIRIKRASMSIMDDNISITDDMYAGFNAQGNYFDQSGNVRVLRVFWRSFKQIHVIEHIDEDGDTQVKFRNEDYIPNPDIGERLTGKRWVSQWWQGTKLGQDVYVDMRPRPIQYNKIGDPGFNTPGVVGQIYNTNDQKAVSLLDRAKVFNYIFNGAFYRLMEAYSKYFGPILEIDKAKFPEGWDITKTLYFAKKAGVLVVDSFREGSKGNSTGKLAGAVGNTTGGIYNADIGSYIQQNISVMEYAKSMMDEITGVPKQRLGNVEKRETVGGVDTAIRQSNYVTEMIFKTHEDLKRRALELILETAKIAMKGNKLKLSYIGSDYSNQVMDIDGDEFNEDQHGLTITNDTEVEKLEQNLDMLAQAALQNQTLSFSTIMKIYSSPSLTEIQRLIEKDEKQMIERQSEESKAERDSQQAMKQEETALESAKLEKDYYAIDEKSRIEELKLIMAGEDVDGVPDDNNPNKDDSELDWRKHLDTLKLDMQKRDDSMVMHRDKMKMDARKISASKAKKATAKV